MLEDLTNSLGLTQTQYETEYENEEYDNEPEHSATNSSSISNGQNVLDSGSDPDYSYHYQQGLTTYYKDPPGVNVIKL